MGDEIDQLKSVLRSLVVSSPTQVTVVSLLRDYKNMIGAPLPLTKYGHREPVAFLKERFSDCFLFGGSPSNPILTLIVPDTLKHIDKFVQCQKNSSGRSAPKRRSVLESVVNPPKENLITKTFGQRKPSTETNKLPQNDIEIKSMKNNNLPTETNTVQFSEENGLMSSNSADIKSKLNTHEPNVSPNKPTITCSKPKLSPSKSYITPCEQSTIIGRCNNNNIIEDDIKENQTTQVSSSSNAVKNFLKKRLPAYNSLNNLDDEDSAVRWGTTTQDDDSGLHTLSSGSSAKAQQLEQLKSDIMVLISEAPEGVWCTDLIRIYRDRYHRDLNFARFGFTSILSLVYCLESEVQITRPVDTGDWLLQERVKAITAPPTLRPRRQRTSHLITHKSKHADPEEALPGIDFDPDVFPEDCMHFMESIDSVSLQDFRPGAMVGVMIGEVYSPSHFWFIRLGDNYNIAMEDMMDEMSRYYNNGGRDRVLARGAVRVGHYCAALYENDWHRSLIVKIVDSDTVKVRHVDYGTVDTVAVSLLKPLRREWARPAAQAARARLGGVRPPAAGWRWPRAAAAAFLALVSNRRLVANVVALDQRDMVAEVLLIDTSSAEDVCIGSELIRAGHADTRPDSALRTVDVYLYPRFEALESGATPNYAEIHAYLRDGIALDYVEEYRAHVPVVLTDPPACSDSPASSPAPYNSLLPLPTGTRSSLSSGQGSQTSSESAIVDSPTTSSEVEHVPESEEPAEETDVPTRIPLFLPDQTYPQKSASPHKTAPSPSQTQGKSDVAAQTTEPSHSVCRSLPNPPSYLSPHAPAYVPGASYHVAPQDTYRPPAPGAYVRSPPPPYGGPAPPLQPPGVTLSMAECETYRALSHVNPAAAHWFIVGAMGRAAAVPVSPRPMPPIMQPMPHPQMHPHSQMFPPHLQMQPMHPPPRLRPPPGFGR